MELLSRWAVCTMRPRGRTTEKIEIQINGWARQQAGRVLRVIDDSIREGFLPAAPRQDACRRGDYLTGCGPYEEERIVAQAFAGIEGSGTTAEVTLEPGSYHQPSCGSFGRHRQDTRIGKSIRGDGLRGYAGGPNGGGDVHARRRGER